jgi:hypothetical protein
VLAIIIYTIARVELAAAEVAAVNAHSQLQLATIASNSLLFETFRLA